MAMSAAMAMSAESAIQTLLGHGKSSTIQVDVSPRRRRLERKTTPMDDSYPVPAGEFATIHERYGGLDDLQLQDVCGDVLSVGQ